MELVNAIFAAWSSYSLDLVSIVTLADWTFVRKVLVIRLLNMPKPPTGLKSVVLSCHANTCSVSSTPSSSEFHDQNVRSLGFLGSGSGLSVQPNALDRSLKHLWFGEVKERKSKTSRGPH